jgi:hypothetical protein
MAIAAGGLCAIYVFVMLCIPSLPIGIPEGGIARISRAEYWLILVASMESIWSQWTAGYVPTISDRLSKVGCAAIWMVICTILGWPIARCDGLHQVGRAVNTLAISAGIGSTLASLGVACNAVTFGPQSRFGLVGWFVAVGLGSLIYARRFAGRARIDDTADQAWDSRSDEVLNHSWARRLMGLTALGIAWVVLLTLGGACLPSYDADVREHRSMALRNDYLENRMAQSEYSSWWTGPKGTMMPALFWMNPWVGTPANPLSLSDVRGMVDAVVIGQVVQGMQWSVAICLLVSALSRLYGTFASVLASFAIAAHPGLFELVRLGGGAGEGGLVLVSALSILLTRRNGMLPYASLACIALGAAGNSWVMLLLVTLPIGIRIAFAPRNDLLRRSLWFLVVGAGVLFWSSASLGPIFGLEFARGRGGEGALDACSRIAIHSTVHAPHLIPLALFGMLFSRSRIGRDVGIAFGVWCVVWWIVTPQQDRDWVIAVPLLAWPMASGIAWMQEHGGRVLLAAISGVALVWSIVVLAAWPTSDNRLLAPWETLVVLVDEDEVGQGRAGERIDLAPLVNSLWSGLGEDQRAKKWLLFGSGDAFRWLPAVEVDGPENAGQWSKWLDGLETHKDPVRICHQRLRDNRIGYIVVDWMGWMRGDQAQGANREASYRKIIERLLQSGALRRLEWRRSGVYAECYEVVAEIPGETLSLGSDTPLY